MGGNALKKVQTKRIMPDTYKKLKEFVLSVLHENNIICSTPVELPNKDSYGDLDVIYYQNNVIGPVDLRKFIQDKFNPTEIVRNGDVTSFDMNIEGKEEFSSFQIDLIKIKPTSFDFAKFYFSYGDLGSIIGRISNAFGVKFGIDGTWVYIEPISESFDLTVACDKIVLTEDPREFCKFFDLDYDRWERGFDKITDIFDWIINTNYFNKNIFTVLNHVHRERMVKRKMYLQFLEYINIGIDEISTAEVHRNEIIYGIQSLAIDYFNKNDELLELKLRRLEIKEKNRKFNGNKFIQHGITGKEIGQKITQFKEYVKDTIHSNSSFDFDKWILETSEEEIDRIIKIFLKIV